MARFDPINAYQTFLETLQPYTDIQTEVEYQLTLAKLEQVLELADDKLDDPLNPLVEILSKAVEEYELKHPDLQAFRDEAESIPADIALLRTLMSRHQLTGSDLPEVGDKTMVSRVLNGKRVLSRQAIEKLSKRFGIRAGLFFGE